MPGGRWFHGVRLLRAAGARGGVRRITGPAGCSVRPGSAGRCVRQRARFGRTGGREREHRHEGERAGPSPALGAIGCHRAVTSPARGRLDRGSGIRTRGGRDSRPRHSSRWTGLLRPGRLGIRTGTDPGTIPRALQARPGAWPPLGAVQGLGRPLGPPLRRSSVQTSRSSRDSCAADRFGLGRRAETPSQRRVGMTV